MAGKDDSDSNFEETKRKMMKFISRCNNNKRQLSDLPNEMLVRIFRRINLIDYFSIRGVCKSWNLYFSAKKRDFIRHQPPHVVVLSTHAKRRLQLHNVFDGSTFDTVLPFFGGRRCSGSTSGYLVMDDQSGRSGIWLVNPLNKSEYQLSRSLYNPCRVLMASSTKNSSTSDIVIALGSIEPGYYPTKTNKNKQSIIQIFISKEIIWTGMVFYEQKPVLVLDMAILNENIYVLTEHGRIGIWSLPLHKLLELQEDPMIKFISYSPRLVVLDNKLIVVDFKDIHEFKIYELKLKKLEYIEMVSLEDKALFICDLTSFAICKTSHWNGYSNCIYSICYRTNRCSCYALDGELIESYPIGERGNGTKFGIANPLWYFPHEAYGFPFLPKE